MSGFETAASVSGVISLAIQICTAVKAYYQTFPAHDETEETFARLERLRQILTSLEKIVNILDDESSNGDEQVKIICLHIEQGKDRLKSLLDKHNDSAISASPLSQSFRYFTPGFHRQGIRDINQAVTDFLQNMQVGISILLL